MLLLLFYLMIFGGVKEMTGDDDDGDDGDDGTER